MVVKMQKSVRHLGSIRLIALVIKVFSLLSHKQLSIRFNWPDGGRMTSSEHFVLLFVIVIDPIDIWPPDRHSLFLLDQAQPLLDLGGDSIGTRERED